jgi:hypothetical protein
MPFPFTPSTTSQVAFQSHLTSSTHPSLPSATTSQRTILRSALKAHKRLNGSDQAQNLRSLVTQLTSYLKYLATLDLALGGQAISGEDVDIALVNEIEVSWRPTLSASSTIPGREAERVKAAGLDYELYFTHHTLSTIHTLLARQALLGLYASSPLPNPDQRLAIIRTATQHLTKSHALHAYLVQRSAFSTDGPPTFPAAATDISQPVQTALRDLAQAEINLLSVLKDDPYPALVQQARNKDDREWMIKAPDKPKARVAILQRLCIGAAEKAGVAAVALKSASDATAGDGKGTAKVSRELVEYAENVRAAARAKAMRFAAVDANASWENGKAIAWVRAALAELGMESSVAGGKGGGGKLFSKLKNEFQEKREERRVAKGGGAAWGLDGGMAEEGRVLEFLDAKFGKENDTIDVQIVPDWRPLVAQMPGPMVFPIDEKWKPEVLGEDELAAMRALPDAEDLDLGKGVSSDEDEPPGKERRPAGAFPGTDEDYGKSSYY